MARRLNFGEHALVVGETVKKSFAVSQKTIKSEHRYSLSQGLQDSTLSTLRFETYTFLGCHVERHKIKFAINFPVFFFNSIQFLVPPVSKLHW